MAVYRASAPGRCGIIGNPSDIYGGKVLSCSLPARATSVLTTDVEDALPADPTLWNAATARFPLSNVRVEWSSDVPRSSGLAGSTALLAATLACVLQAKGLLAFENRPAFAELVRDIERHEAGVMCGYQDAYMVVHGGLQLMDFAGKHPVNPGPQATLTAQEAPLPFLLITTGVERLSGGVHGPMAQRWLAGESLVRDSIARIGELAQPGLAALKSGNYGQLGELMDENQRLIAELGGSGDPIDELIALCKASGSLGAKLAGAGMGGTVIALTEDADALEADLRARGYSRFIRPEIAEGIRFESSPE